MWSVTIWLNYTIKKQQQQQKCAESFVNHSHEITTKSNKVGKPSAFQSEWSSHSDPHVCRHVLSGGATARTSADPPAGSSTPHVWTRTLQRSAAHLEGRSQSRHWTHASGDFWGKLNKRFGENGSWTGSGASLGRFDKGPSLDTSTRKVSWCESSTVRMNP